MNVVIDTSALIAVIVGEPEKKKIIELLVPEKLLTSPLDIPSIRSDISTPEIVAVVREGRERDKSRGS